MSDTQGFRRFPIGDIEVTVVVDGARQIPIPDGIVANAPMALVAASLEAAGYPKGIMPFFFNPVVVSDKGRHTLIDTGNGEAAFAQSKGAVGQLNANLEKAGIDRTSIDTVIITHFHGDHVNGLVASDGKAAFPGAEIHVPAEEWAFWMSDRNAQEASDGLKPNFENVKRIFAGLGDRVRQFQSDAVVVPGIRSIATPGHTPGHCSLMVSSGEESVVVQGDVTNLPVMFVRNPGWHARFDMNPIQAETTRRTLYERLLADGIPVTGYHFPVAGIAEVCKQDDGYDLKYL